MNQYLIFCSDPPAPVSADSPEEAIVKLREYLKTLDVYLPVPFTVRVVGEHFDGEVTA